MARLLALIIVVIPGVIAVYGVRLMRDTVFSVLNWPFSILWLQFLSGLIMFLAGLAFIGGFIFYRDKKRKKVTKRLGRRKSIN